MDCEFTEKVSLLVDGELGEEEAKSLRAHVALCATCQKAQEDFLRLRREISAYEPVLDPLAQRRALTAILNSESVPVWRWKIAVPAPVFALLVLAVVALGIWSASSRQKGTPAEAKKTVAAPQAVAPEGGLDLARFDRGGRAVIYKAKQTKNGDLEQ